MGWVEKRERLQAVRRPKRVVVCLKMSVLIVVLRCRTLCLLSYTLSPHPRTLDPSQPAPSLHLLPSNPRPIRIPRHLQPPQPIKTRLLPAHTENVQIMRPPPRKPPFLLPRLLHLSPLLTLRLPLQQPHLLKVHIRGVKRRALASLLGALALEEFGQVAGFDFFVRREEGCEGASEGGLGRMGEAVEVVVYFLADIVAGVEDGDATLGFVGEGYGCEIFEGGFVFGRVFLGVGLCGVDFLARVCGWGLLLLLCAWLVVVLSVVVVGVVSIIRLGSLLALGTLYSVGSPWRLLCQLSWMRCWLATR